MAEIFFSYVQEDGDVVRALADGLEQAGYSVWFYERDSLPGQSYLEQILEVIDQADAVIVILSPAALSSPQVNIEISESHVAGKRFVPLLRDLTYATLVSRQRAWTMMFGTAVAAPIPEDGAAAILPRLLRGLRAIGVAPGEQMERLEPVESEAAGQQLPPVALPSPLTAERLPTAAEVADRHSPRVAKSETASQPVNARAPASSNGAPAELPGSSLSGLWADVQGSTSEERVRRSLPKQESLSTTSRNRSQSFVAQSPERQLRQMSPLLTGVSEKWWIFAVRGGLAILLAVYLSILQSYPLTYWVGSWSLYLLFEGISLLLLVTNQSRHDGRPYLLEGIAGIGAGLTAASLVATYNVSALYALPFWALATGVLKGIEASRLRRETTLAWILGAAGLASLILGVFDLTRGNSIGPRLWGVLLTYRDFLRIYALFVGALYFLLSIRLRASLDRSSASE